MDSIERAQSAYAQLEHAITEDRTADPLDRPPFSPGLLIWQIAAGIVGLFETAASTSLTASVPHSFVIWLLPFTSGSLLLVSVFSRHRKVPGILGTIGTLVCAAAVVFVLWLFSKN
ncbi:MAG: hypothetical protein QM723_05900 [Myxococcaceae bacterium]